MRRHLALVVSCLVGILIGGASIAFANIGGGGVINGCYQQTNGQLRVVSAGSDCRTGELAISWNVAGAQGPAGPQGATGPQGPAGTSNTSYYTVFSEFTVSTSQLPPPYSIGVGQADGYAVCHTGDQVVSGGFYTGGNVYLTVGASEPMYAGLGWHINVTNFAPYVISSPVTAIAYCVH